MRFLVHRATRPLFRRERVSRDLIRSRIDASGRLSGLMDSRTIFLDPGKTRRLLMKDLLNEEVDMSIETEGARSSHRGA